MDGKNNSVIQLTDELIEIELNLYKSNGHLEVKNFDDFALGLRAGIAFACRTNKSIPCFCGCHIGQLDE